MILRIHKKRSLLVVLFVFLLFQQAILEYTDGIIHTLVGYTDELLECGLIYMIIVSILYKKTRLTRAEYGMLGCFAVFVIMGLLSNLMTPMQGWFVNLVDLLICSRFLVFYFAVRVLMDKPETYHAVLRALAKACRWIAVILTLVALHDIFMTPWFPKREYRYFMHSLQLCFPHPTFLAAVCMTCAGVLMAYLGVCDRTKERRWNMVCLAMLLALTCLTFRSKALAAVCCVVVLYYLVVKYNVKSKLVLIGGGAALALIIGWEQISFFYFAHMEDAVRARLHWDSLALANEYFPFGTGFATFGSYMAADHYSPLYHQLGYNRLHGGSIDDARYLCDTFWPAVLAQTGWIGAIAFVGMVMYLMIAIFRMQKKSRYLFWAGLSIVVFELIASTSETAFFSPSASLLLALLGLLVNMCERTNMETKPTQN